MRVALYTRVSTADQHPEIQAEALAAYAEARGLEVVATYTDHGVSGAKSKRPALDRMMAAARKRQFDAIAITKLDRLARSVHHLTALGKELEALGVDLIVTEQGIDTTTPAGRFTFHILGAVAELERDLIRDRTVAGVQAAKRRGKRLGRPPVVDSEKAQRIKRLRGSGHSLRAIARLLGLSAATVHRVAAA